MNGKPKILYVDDERLNLDLFEINFSNKYEVFTAENGLKGLNLVDNNPDIMVVLSDMKMPGLSGIEFIKESTSRHPNMSYFILSGYDITNEIQEALNTGLIINYFRKPFKMSEIGSAIENAVK